MFELEVVIGVERQLLVLVLDARIGTLKVVPRRDFLVGLVERITDFDLIDFGDDVE